LLFTALMLVLGVLTKGFVALFPWSFPFFFWICWRTISFPRMLGDTIALIALTSIPFILLILISSEAADSLQKYYYQQVVRSILEIQTAGSRFYILKKPFEELLPAMGMALVACLIAFRKNYNFHSLKSSFLRALPFLFIAFSGVVPIMVSMKQSAVYNLPVYPFLAIALALISLPVIEFLWKSINFNGRGYKIFKYGAYLLFILGLILSLVQKDRIGRNREILLDVYSIIKIIPSGQVIGICPELWDDWELYGYLHRYANISLDPNEKNEHIFFLGLSQDTCEKEQNLRKYDQIALPLKKLVLYQMK